MVDIDRVHKQKRYIDEETGDDWIDKYAKHSELIKFRGAMEFVIGKYYARLGKKDPVEQEKAKINDYVQRWAFVESSNSSNGSHLESLEWVIGKVVEIRKLAQSGEGEQ